MQVKQKELYFENGDTNAAFMYLIIDFLSIGLFVTAKTLTLTFLVEILARYKLASIPFLFISAIMVDKWLI
jgi:hypothetical protein